MAAPAHSTRRRHDATTTTAAAAAAATTASGVKRHRNTSAALAASVTAAARRRAVRAARVESAARASAAHAEYAHGGARPAPPAELEERLMDTIHTLVPAIEARFGTSNARGTFVSKDDSAHVLRLLCALHGHGLTTERMLEVVRRALGFSDSTVRKVVHVYADSGALYASSPGKRGRTAPAALADGAKIKAALVELVQSRLAGGGGGGSSSGVTTAVAQEHIAKLFGSKPSVKATRRHFHDLGLAVGKKLGVPSTTVDT